MGDPLERLRKSVAGLDAAIETLHGLNGPDLTSVLLETFRRRGSEVTHLPAQAQQSRFARPAAVSFETLRRVEDAVLGVVPEGVELVQLAPSTPSGAHVALGGGSQDRLVTTVRRTEMAADPTVGLAIEIAARRRDDRRDMALATVQRVTRAQVFDGPRSYGHFTLFGLVTAGRDRGSFAFERETAVEHLRFMIRAVTCAGGTEPEVTVIDPSPDRPILGAVEDALGEQVAVHDRGRTLGEYYRTARFGVTVVVAGERIDVGDGGFTDWTAAMLSDRKDRLCISGIGLDRLCVDQGDDPPATP